MTRLATDALDALALRAAAGDRMAEEQVLKSVGAVINAAVTKCCRATTLRPHREDLQSEATFAAILAIRRFDGRRPLMTYLAPCVSLSLKRAARMWWSPEGAHITTNDYTFDVNAPIFRPYKDLVRKNGDEYLMAPKSNEQSCAEDREFLLRWLRDRGLSPLEREVVLRRWGVYWKNGTGTAEEAEAMTPHSLKQIAADHGLSGARIWQIYAKARLKAEITGMAQWEDKPIR